MRIKFPFKRKGLTSWGTACVSVGSNFEILEGDNLCITEDKTNKLKVNRIKRYILLLTLVYLFICEALKLYE